MFRNANPKNPIGIFDSGVGGLTVANAINRKLPKEEIIYMGDTVHLPYGDKSADAIRYYSIKIVKFLLEQNCKLIVIACNSASSAAYEVLLDFFDGEVLFVNVVDPLVKEVTEKKFRKVGVIATKATVRSGVYSAKLMEKQPGLSVKALATPLLVPMIEEGFFQNQISQSIIEKYLTVEEFDNIDALLLACTHYPLIRKDIEKHFNNLIEIYDSTDVVAQAVEEVLKEHDLLNDQRRKNHKFFVSDFTSSFEETTKIFYDEHIELQQCSIWKE